MSEYLPYNIFLMVFLDEQEYNINDDIIYQDNKCAIQMEKMGEFCVLGAGVSNHSIT